MKNAIVIIRGEKDSSFDEKVHKLAGESDINVVGIFHDYRIGDSDWAFERYEDRLAFTKGVERDAKAIIVQSDFFSGIGQNDWLERQLVCRALTKLKFELLVISDDFSKVETGKELLSDIEPKMDYQEDVFKSVKRYEKLVVNLIRLRRKVLNERRGILTLTGEGKVGGRRSYLEMNPELVLRTKELRSKGYKHKEISKVLFDMGFVNGKGKEFAPTQISRIIKQAEKISDENE